MQRVIATAMLVLFSQNINAIQNTNIVSLKYLKGNKSQGMQSMEFSGKDCKIFQTDKFTKINYIQADIKNCEEIIKELSKISKASIEKKENVDFIKYEKFTARLTINDKSYSVNMNKAVYCEDIEMKKCKDNRRDIDLFAHFFEEKINDSMPAK